MTHARSPRDRRRRGRRGGFTLIELLVVIAIVAVLAAIGSYGFLRVRGQARLQMGESLMSSIQMGLETYKSEMNAYPPSSWEKIMPSGPDWYGAQCLAEAMLGYLDADGGSSWVDGQDGADGDGFRVRPRGKVHGPYIDTKVKTELTEVRSGGGDDRRVLLDPEGNPILYYLYDHDTAAEKYFDEHNTGGPADINAYAAGRDRKKFVLCTPGPDGKYGDTADDKDGEDDFTNFGEE